MKTNSLYSFLNQGGGGGGGGSVAALLFPTPRMYIYLFFSSGHLAW